MSSADVRILIFCKAPIPGEAKTRLIATLGAEGAAALHARLAQRTIATATRASVGPVELWGYPDAEHPFFRRANETWSIVLHRQTGGDLGERMANALREALRRAPHAIVIGTDCPALEPAHLVQAAQHLRDGQDAVLGPARDGGYVLLGLNQPRNFLFSGMPWGTGSVLSETRLRLHAAGLRWQELPELWDVDTAEDLDDLRILEATQEGKAS